MVSTGGASSITSTPWGGLLPALVFGPVFVGIGLALATNFRGFTESHVRTTFRFMRGPESLLPKRLMRAPLESRIRKAVKRERVMGVVFALLGGSMVVGGVIAFVRSLV